MNSIKLGKKDGSVSLHTHYVKSAVFQTLDISESSLYDLYFLKFVQDNLKVYERFQTALLLYTNPWPS